MEEIEMKKKTVAMRTWGGSQRRGEWEWGGVWEEKPQGRLSLFVFPLPSTGQSHEEDREKGEEEEEDRGATRGRDGK